MFNLSNDFDDWKKFSPLVDNFLGRVNSLVGLNKGDDLCRVLADKVGPLIDDFNIKAFYLDANKFISFGLSTAVRKQDNAMKIKIQIRLADKTSKLESMGTFDLKEFPIN